MQRMSLRKFNLRWRQNRGNTMLAQSFKPAAELDITEPQRDALCKTLVLLETGKLQHVPIYDRDIGADPGPSFEGKFNMAQYNVRTECGTVMCLCGTAEMIGDVQFSDNWNDGLDELFRPTIKGKLDISLWRRITPSQAATALRSYLTTGDAKWHEALA